MKKSFLPARAYDDFSLPSAYDDFRPPRFFYKNGGRKIFIKTAAAEKYKKPCTDRGQWRQGRNVRAANAEKEQRTQKKSPHRGQGKEKAARGRSVRFTVTKCIIAEGGKCGGHSLSAFAVTVSDAAKVDNNHIKTGLV